MSSRASVTARSLEAHQLSGEDDAEGLRFSRRSSSSPESAELEDVPAAVVCAQCGSADCPGCLPDSMETTHASQVVAIVPWERPRLGFWRRLWGTSTLATCQGEHFFAALPDGDLGHALRFAVAAELFAVGGLALLVLPAIGLVVGDALVLDPVVRGIALRLAVLGIPGLAGLMVVLHAAYGVGLDWGAQRQGSRGKLRRGLRFGLYGCGLDVVTLPIGLFLLAITGGSGSAVRSLNLGITAPRRASLGYLRGGLHLDDAQCQRANRFATWVIGGPLVLIALVFCTALILLILRGF